METTTPGFNENINIPLSDVLDEVNNNGTGCLLGIAGTAAINWYI